MQTNIKFILLLCVLSFASCSGNDQEKNKKTEKKEDLVELKDGVFTEYYPGKKVIKFQGRMDENESRDGHWFFYNEKGKEMNMTEYVHGKKEGVSFVRYPNGNLHYIGEYTNNVPSGVWKTYKQDGTLDSEHDYGTPAEPEVAKTK